MTVLVIDDQINVVSGIVSGVDWAAVGVDRVLQAYNAAEAKEILLHQRIDMMLCDIEMPVESGLDLFRWVRDQQMETECIFLTAHADFDYAKEAVRLGGLDYILQPARYADIQAAVLRAAHRIETKKELQAYSSYGKMMARRRDVLMEGLLKNWFLGEAVSLPQLLEDFQKLEIRIDDVTPVYFTLIQVLRWEDAAAAWSAELLKYAFINVLSELFGEHGQKLLLIQLDHYNFAFLSYADGPSLLDEDAHRTLLEHFLQVCRAHFHCDAACYTGSRLTPPELTERAQVLYGCRRGNVALAAKVFIWGSPAEVPQGRLTAPEWKQWEGRLVRGDVETVRTEACRWLDGAAADGKLSVETLQRFYQEFLQMLCAAGELANVPADAFLPGRQLFARSPQEGFTIDGVKQWIEAAVQPFARAGQPADVKSQVEQIKQYIETHMERDIRRSDIAEAFYLNPDYLSRLFKKETGVQLKDYIVAEKMKAAQTLLRTTDLPVSMVAVRVGYSNFSHFSQVYKKAMGRTPAEDRAAVRGLLSD